MGPRAVSLSLSGVASFAATAAGAVEISPQEIVLRAKPATVLVVSEVAADVTVDCGAGPTKVTPSAFRETGTGWFIDSNGWVVTNAHVVQPSHEVPRWVTHELAQKGAALACDETARAAALESAKVEPRASIFILLGYPGVVLTHELLNATAKVEASVTNGAISGFKQDVQNQAVIQTDAPAAWGNSGGPAIDGRGDVIGVLTFVSLASGPEGAIVQGFNFVIPADAVRGFLAGTGVDLAERSPFNDKWHAGLSRFFTDDWTGAVVLFREADRLQPEFPDRRRMLAEAEEKAKNPPPRRLSWTRAHQHARRRRGAPARLPRRPRAGRRARWLDQRRTSTRGQAGRALAGNGTRRRSVQPAGRPARILRVRTPVCVTVGGVDGDGHPRHGSVTDFLPDTPAVARPYCPDCEPDADPCREILDVRWCAAHTPAWSGAEDSSVRAEAFLSGSTEAGGDDNRRWCQLVHRPARSTAAVTAGSARRRTARVPARIVPAT